MPPIKIIRGLSVSFQCGAFIQLHVHVHLTDVSQLWGMTQRQMYVCTKYWWMTRSINTHPQSDSGGKPTISDTMTYDWTPQADKHHIHSASTSSPKFIQRNTPHLAHLNQRIHMSNPNAVPLSPFFNILWNIHESLSHHPWGMWLIDSTLTTS